MDHYIFTGGKTSEGFIRTGGNYLDGRGKGKGRSPVIWIYLFEIILTVIYPTQPGIILKAPDGGGGEDIRTT